MARLAAPDNDVDEQLLPSSPLAGEDDEDGNGDAVIVQHLGSDFPQILSDNLRSSQNADQSSQDLPSAQLYQEQQKMGAALSKEDAKDAVQVAAAELFPPSSPIIADSRTVVESAALLNVSSAMGTSSRLAKPQPAASGKLKRPSGHFSTLSAQRPRLGRKANLPAEQIMPDTPRKDMYEVDESPQKPPQSAQPIRSSGSVVNPDAREQYQEADEGDARVSRISPKRPRKDGLSNEQPSKRTAGRRTGRATRVASDAQSAPLADVGARRVTRSTAKDTVVESAKVEQKAEATKSRRGLGSDARISDSGRKEGEDPQASARISSGAVGSNPSKRGRGRPKKSSNRAAEGADDADNVHAEESIQDASHDVGESSQPATRARGKRYNVRRQSPRVEVPERVPTPLAEDDSEAEQAVAGASPQSDVQDVEDSKPSEDESAKASRQQQQQDDPISKTRNSNQSPQHADDSGEYVSKRLRESDRLGNEEFERKVEDAQVLGQKETLMQIFQGLREIGRQTRKGRHYRHHFKFLTETGEEVAAACDKAKECYVKLAQAESDDGGLQDGVDQAMDDVRTHVEALDPDNTEEDSADLAHDVYALVFHILVGLLRTAILCHIEHSELSNGSGMLPPSALEEIVELSHLIVDLEERAKDWKARPGGDYPLKKPVHNKIVAPMRTVRAAFSRQLDEHEKEAARREHAALKRKQKRQRKAQEAQDEEEAARLAEKESQWDELIIARLLLETDPRRFRSSHLAKQDREVTDVDVDANGDPFEREDMFSARHTGRRPLYDPKACQEWPDDHIDALMDGLEECSRKYKGVEVFKQVITKLCRPGGILRDYNVREITDEVAYVRDTLKRSRDTEVPQWLLDLPDPDPQLYGLPSRSSSSDFL